MRQHTATLVLIQRDQLTAYLIRDYFDLPRTENLMSALLSRHLGQADLVLALLRIRDHSSKDWRNVLSHYIRRLVGKPIKICTPCLLKYRMNGTPSCTYRDPSPRITFVTSRNPRDPTSQAFLRWPDFKVGRTLNQLRVRGHKRRDIKHAIAQGWIQVTN